ncbi:MAG: PRC-barrel domain-containing protein [Actinomycetota bacterium]|nr:PRC-barrel domain-containing protein [Actinomycetota bacterium]
MASEERLRELEEKYEDYKVYDNRGDKIGKVDDLFVDQADQEEYIGVKLGLLGMKSTLIPMEIVRVNEADRTIEVSETKDHVKEAPSFDDEEDITSEYESRVRTHFGLEPVESSSSRGAYGGHSETGGAATGASTATEELEQDESRDYSTHDESTGSASGAGGSQSVPEYQAPGESSGHGESGGGSGNLGSSEGTTSSEPSSRQTEETETFQEGGRTKVRRRIIREEIFDADEDQGTRL